VSLDSTVQYPFLSFFFFFLKKKHLNCLDESIIKWKNNDILVQNSAAKSGDSENPSTLLPRPKPHAVLTRPVGQACGHLCSPDKRPERLPEHPLSWCGENAEWGG
jgi:hypothetical protein